MSFFVEIDHVDKVFPLSGGGEYVALRNIDLNIKQGEFVSLVGHSGCGKSTLLNIVAGFDQQTTGGVVLEGKQVTSPGPDRMMVFQNYSLLPWLTVRQNIALAVDKVMGHLPKGERRTIIEHNINLVGLSAAADKKPGQLSGGMKQRTAIARALAISPKMLLLDEPFGALDALTRGNLQAQLMEICQAAQITCLMVTHDVDEALLLSDRVVLMTNGPEAHIGQILEVNIPRPRQRLEVVKHPSYYDLRAQVIYFLNQQKRDKRRQAQKQTQKQTQKPAMAAVAAGGLEKTTLRLGYVATTDCAPLIVAQAQGLFKKYGLEHVELVRETSWEDLTQGIVSGQLDAAQMLAGMPLAISLGAGGRAPVPVITALVTARNGSAITLSRQFRDRGVTSLADLKAVISQSPEQAHRFGVVHDASMGSLLLRYWLAAGGIDPDRDVNLTQMSSVDMQSGLVDGQVDGYFAAEPWNSRAVKAGVGMVVATDLEIWNGHQSKVLGVRSDWADQNPQTHLALMKALMVACEYCDDQRHREELVTLLSSSDYCGLDPEGLRPGLVDRYDRGTDAPPARLTRYPQFYVEQATCPRRMEAVWILTQLARWGITPFPKNWLEMLEQTYRVEVYGQAARDLGMPDAEPDRRTPVTLFDGIVFNPDDPLQYLNSLSISRPIQIAEIALDSSALDSSSVRAA
jgi:nitrate/nitrite transport system ATP-binding protein